MKRLNFVGAKLTDAEAGALKLLALEKGVSKSEVLRWLIVEAFNNSAVLPSKRRK